MQDSIPVRPGVCRRRWVASWPRSGIFVVGRESGRGPGQRGRRRKFARPVGVVRPSTSVIKVVRDERLAPIVIVRVEREGEVKQGERNAREADNLNGDATPRPLLFLRDGPSIGTGRAGHLDRDQRSVDPAGGDGEPLGP
jgi:hypothetical protein